MATRLVVNHRENWLLPGSPDDSRLFHSDPSDEILLYPSHIGQGYRQKIQLRDDVTLVIVDYVLNRNVILNTINTNVFAKFEFPLDGNNHHSYVSQIIGFRSLEAPAVKERVFEIEVVFTGPSMATYGQACFERLPHHTRRLIENVIQCMWRSQGKRLGAHLNTYEMVRRLAQYVAKEGFSAHSEGLLGQALPARLYSEVGDVGYAKRTSITPAMETIIGHILGCPYQGLTRRRYLERKALELVNLRVQAIAPPNLHQTELDCIYEAASILRHQLVNPPTVKTLARNVMTNRLKLNQGFQNVYGTTPFQYLRDHRIQEAVRLLQLADMSVDHAAVAVGYKSRSHFTKAFRQLMGMNPKVFQLQAQAWPIAS